MVDPPQAITAELRRWIIAQAESGCRPEEVIAGMRAAGWAEGVAADAMEQTLRERLDELRPSTADAPPASAVPEPDLRAAPTVLQVEGHELRVLLSLHRPRVVVFGGFMSDDECDRLMALAAPRWRVRRPWTTPPPAAAKSTPHEPATACSSSAVNTR